MRLRKQISGVLIANWERAPTLLDCPTLAQSMDLSARALARRLAREGTTFTRVLDEICFERAHPMLRSGTPAIEVASALGYAELSSFFRAFRRWTGGLTPSEFRRVGGRGRPRLDSGS